MKAANTTLINYLAANSQFFMADLVQITLVNSLGFTTSQVYYWTEADTNLTYNGQVYTAAVDQGGQPLLERGAIRTERGLKSSTMDLTLYCGQSAKILGVNAQLAAHNGAFDMAEVLITRVVMPTWGDCSTLGGCVLFDGVVASVEIGSTEVVLHVASWIQNLSIQMPRTLFLPQCANTFCDASCGLSLASVTQTGTVAAGSTTTSINGLPSKAANYWQNGVITFTSGANTGVSMAISAYAAGGAATLVMPLPNAPSTGDAFSVYPGCAKTLGACLTYGSTTAGGFQVNQQYMVTFAGTTNWSACGTNWNGTVGAVGSTFTATAGGSGTGTASGNLGNFRGCPFVPPAESGL